MEIKTQDDLLDELRKQLVQRKYSAFGRYEIMRQAKNILGDPGKSLEETIHLGLRHLRQQHLTGGIPAHSMKNYERTARRLMAMLRGDCTSEWRRTHTKPDILFSPPIQHILDEFKAHLLDSALVGWNTNLSCARTFLRWTSARGISDLSSLTAEHVFGYFAQMRETSVGVGINSIRGKLKWFFTFLREKGVVSQSCVAAIELPVNCRRHLLPAFSQGEYATIIDAASKDVTSCGRRNLAIIRIAATTGMRVGDVVRLTFRDVDWKNGSISFVQRKTGIPNTLPLLGDVGDALRDYILNHRPECPAQCIFISSRPPFVPLSRNAASSGFARLLVKCGIKKHGLDGMSFHALRRTMGRDLVSAGIELPTIRQVLGHAQLDSVSRYISLDPRSLRFCALDFTGIKPNGGTST